MDHHEVQRLPVPNVPLRISREADALLRVLRGSGSVCDLTSMEWDHLLALAASHGMLPLFCRNYSGCLPEAFYQGARRHWVTSAQLTTELGRLLRLFAREHIEVIPLKGPVLAESLYGSKSLRACDDLDLLVKPQDYARAQDLLIDAGFVLLEEEGNYHRTLVGRDVLVELHFAVASPAFPRFDLDGAWERSRSTNCCGQPIRYFEKCDLFLYMVLHGVKHHYSRLLWLFDVTRALDGIGETEADTLLAMSREVGTTGAVLVSCLLAKLLFEVHLPGPIEAAIATMPGISEQAHQLAENILGGPATTGTPAQNVSLFVDLERGVRRRWAHRLRFFIATQQDRLWAQRYGIPMSWVGCLRPFRLLFTHGPAIALRTVFPKSAYMTSATAKLRLQPVTADAEKRPVQRTDS